MSGHGPPGNRPGQAAGASDGRGMRLPETGKRRPAKPVEEGQGLQTDDTTDVAVRARLAGIPGYTENSRVPLRFSCEMLPVRRGRPSWD